MQEIDEEKIKAEAEKHLLQCRPGDWKHALRVVKWIKELGQGRSDLLLITTAGYIHDIGWEGIFPAGKEKITFDELLQFEEQANKNSEGFVTDFLTPFNFNEKEVGIVNRLIKAADEHKSDQDDEAIIVDADQLSKLTINHLKEKYQPSEWLRMHGVFSEMFPKRIKTEIGKSRFPSLLNDLKISIEKESAAKEKP